MRERCDAIKIVSLFTSFMDEEALETSAFR
jgi:hypothetical protein